jgi:hypothetical protein
VGSLQKERAFFIYGIILSNERGIVFFILANRVGILQESEISKERRGNFRGI